MVKIFLILSRQKAHVINIEITKIIKKTNFISYKTIAKTVEKSTVTTIDYQIQVSMRLNYKKEETL